MSNLSAKTVPDHRSIVFVSANIKNYDTLLGNLSSDVDVYLLNTEQDGILQMATILQGRSELDAIHIISNGNSGELSLGATILNSHNLSLYSDTLAQIGSSLSATGDILLYGCNVAQGNTGVQFINSLAQYTRADVVASNDLTGNAALGGDWVLEASTGAIEASSLTNDGYAGLLTDVAIPVVTLSSTFPSMREGDIGSKLMTFTVVLSTAATSEVTVNYATGNGSALAGSDYTATSGILTFAAGETSKTFTVEVLSDTVYENNENFSVNLSNPSGAILGKNGSASAIATIINDDVPPLPTVTLSSTFPSIAEGNIGSKLMTFTAVLSTAATAAVTIDYATSNGSAIAGSDYTATSGTLTFAAGETSKTFTVEVLGDKVYENNENFSVNLSNPSGALLGNNGSASAIATIINDDVPTVTLSPTFPSITEGNIDSKLMTFTVVLSTATTSAVTIDYATSNGSAIAGSDYTATSGTLTFAAGETSKTFTVEVLSDTAYENNENFSVNLSNPSGAVLGNNGSASAIATIINDDVSPLPTVTLSPTFPSIKEGDIDSKLMTFTAVLSTAATSEVTIDYATSNGSAIAGSDYTAASGILTFAAGETNKTFTVEVLGDTVYENNEDFSVDLSNPSGAVLGNNGSASAIAMITDDDDVSTLPTVTLSPTFPDLFGYL